MSKAPEGIYVPLITPFNEDESIDFIAYQKMIDFVIENGVHGMRCQIWLGTPPLLSPHLGPRHYQFF